MKRVGRALSSPTSFGLGTSIDPNPLYLESLLHQDRDDFLQPLARFGTAAVLPPPPLPSPSLPLLPSCHLTSFPPVSFLGRARFFFFCISLSIPRNGTCQSDCHGRGPRTAPRHHLLPRCSARQLRTELVPAAAARGTPQDDARHAVPYAPQHRILRIEPLLQRPLEVCVRTV